MRNNRFNSYAKRIALSTEASPGLRFSKRLRLTFRGGFFLLLLLCISVTAFSNLNTVSAGNPSKVVFVGGTSQALSTYEISSPITVQLQDSNGNPATPLILPIVISLSSNSSGGSGGFFSSDSNGNTKIDKVTIPQSATSASFYYYDLTVGSPKLTASSIGITSDFAQFSITPANLLFASGATQILSSYSLSQPINVQLQDSEGNPISIPGAEKDYKVNLATNSTGANGGVFCSDSIGGTTITSVTINTDSNSAFFYYYDLTPGSPVITGTSTSLSTQTQFIISQSKLAITTGTSQWILPGTVSQPITVELQTSGGNSISMPSNIGSITVSLASNSTGGSGGFFYSDSGGTHKINSCQLSSSSTSSTFYYLDSIIGTPVITASKVGLISATTQFTIDPNPSPTPTPTTSSTPTPTATPTITPTPSPTPTLTPTPSETPPPTTSPTPNETPTSTPTSNPTSTIEPSPTLAPTSPATTPFSSQMPSQTYYTPIPTSTSTRSPLPTTTQNTEFPLHDIDISQITPSPKQIVFGQPLSFEVTILNKGVSNETFSVTLYGNDTIIGNQTITAMPSNSERTLSFPWNTSGFAKENVYSIKAITSEIKNDSNPENNVYTLNSVKQTENSTIPIGFGLWGGGLTWIFITIGLAGPAATSVLVIRKRKPKSPDLELRNSNPKSFQGMSEINDETFPDAYSVMIVGGADSEKSTFCQQLANGYLKQGKSILYITYDQFPEEVRINMRELGWEISGYEQKESFIFLDAYSSIGGKHSKENFLLNNHLRCLS